jgi:hypothetical protein
MQMGRNWSKHDSLRALGSAGRPETTKQPLYLIDRYRGALLGLAVSDALGTTLEFKRPGTFEPVSDMVGGGPFRLIKLVPVMRDVVDGVELFFCNRPYGKTGAPIAE